MTGFKQRCRVSEQCLPEAPYRAMLVALHDEMLEALAQPAQEPVALVDLQKKAQQIVESKALWKKFIDGTPLANDIACWMTDFARQYTAPPQRPWVGLTEDEKTKAIWTDGSFGAGALWAEAKLKEKNT